MIVRNVIDSYRRYPYRNIFLMLMAIVLFDAIAPNEAARGQFSDLTMVAVLAAALWETVRSRRNAIAALVLGLPAIVCRLLSAWIPDSRPWNSAVLMLTTVFFLFLLWNLLHDLLGSERKTSEQIFGALCAYLFIGILFALVYTHIEYSRPGSFSIPDPGVIEETPVESTLMPTFTYYSFVTLTTLGYGDILPVSENARTLSWMEALLGQIFLAVMVAGFVAKHMTGSANRSVRDSSESERESKPDED
jgi:hypothetical protein